MLKFQKDLIGVKITDLSRGRVIASVVDLVIDPNELSVAALICFSRAKNEDLFLLPTDIYEFSGSSIVVQNDDALVTHENLVKLDDLLKINFKILNKKVKTESNKKVGTVNEFVVDDASLKIIKLYVRPPVTRIIQNSDRIIGRAQIIEVNDKEIIVRDSVERSKSFARVGVDV